MKSASWLATLALGSSLLFSPSTATACGSFFCSTTPVDQNAERIIFKVRDDGKTDMVIQIAYQGKAPDFAWLLPLAEPPTKEDLGTFPQLAMTALDGQTGPQVYGNYCYESAAGGNSGGVPSAEDGGTPTPPKVDVYVREQIGNYDVAVIGSTSAQASADWLIENDFRISDAMLGFIELYTAEKMKFLALKLLPDKAVTDITPFRVTLPGDSPSIPLRLTGVAAEPEMGIVTWIFGDSRYEPANAAELTIADEDLVVDPTTGDSNWLSMVARAVDAAQGKGWVVEHAEAVTNIRSFIESSFANDTMQQEAREALLDVLAGTTYVTRLYTRVSPEEMTYDPLFKRSSKGDVSRFHQAGGETNSCDQPVVEPTPCDFTACGALGLCREVEGDGAIGAACACAPGFTARTTFVPMLDGTMRTTISCVDKQLSFLNPGDKNRKGEVLPDPCPGFSCGEHGKCVAMNMTPTCDCDVGYVARGYVNKDDSRGATCVVPTKSVPEGFYNRRAMQRSEKLPIGREEFVPPPNGMSDLEDPVPEGNLDAMVDAPASSGMCAVASPGLPRDTTWLGLGALGCLAALRRRRFRG